MAWIDVEIDQTSQLVSDASVLMLSAEEGAFEWAYGGFNSLGDLALMVDE
jgi:hypothetical protein